MRQRQLFGRIALPLLCMLALLVTAAFGSSSRVYASTRAESNLAPVFDQVATEFGVPASLLKTICYMEGRLSNHGGSPSIDQGYGCMHLVKNKHADTLDQAAQLLNVSTDLLKSDIATNIRGGAAVLRAQALQLSNNMGLPASLNDWYGTVAAYSHATTQSTTSMYADAVYTILKQGFSAQTEKGETITLTPQNVTANKSTARSVKGTTALPAGCVNDGKTDYPGAINCILDPATFDCNAVGADDPCTYESANRPNDFPVKFVTIHDIEGSALAGLNAFQDVNSGVSIHYIVDTDGTVYQILHDSDIGYHIGNYWYNQRSIGIEHAGFDATGFQWYNAAEYLGSAKLVAYLLKKYNIPLDREHLVAHGTVPSPALPFAPNHVDPGPYWLWTYYMELVHKQGVPYPGGKNNSHIITLKPSTDKKPANKNGTETPANFNFFYLYNGPSTASGLIPHGSDTDITDETDNVETNVSYAYLDKVKDPAGTGYTMYEIWYGEETHLHDTTVSHFANAKTAWLAVPPGAAVESSGTLVSLSLSGSDVAKVYGRPTATDYYQIGDAPNNSIFVSKITTTEADGTLWYEINYNHRQAWIPSSEITVIKKVG
ncbi:N-acetylmuramoyl-L-alanine amidase [Ktedonospora formicarum]|uniref:N-acetylmuramoyl-L-alanine amidase n=1 Tax=Ktedonospora formicarum TaxID=2778364 RepID=A0A8J3HT99_9CHLR|nr:peptidoglycan recognition family protein [Ktedonospora formicarum]GHO42861.1 amidase [Ktedonospora formicarum]